MKIGLFFGTFNPIHVGHLIIANYMADHTDLDQIWLVVSPQNPFKQKSTLLADHHRLAMVRVAVEDNSKLRASNIEFALSKPSYTIHTLTYLREKHPEYEFALIMGEDNLDGLNKWKNYEQILNEYSIFVYPRVPATLEDRKTIKPTPALAKHTKVTLIDAPVMKLSSSIIRRLIKEGKDVRYMLSEPVYNYLTEMHFYKK